MIEFEQEGFRLRKLPLHNKKARRHHRIPKDQIRIVQVASGNIRHKGKTKYIVRTSPIVSDQFDPITGYMSFRTENGKNYCVPYKPEAE